jgi:hypothetical protein
MPGKSMAVQEIHNECARAFKGQILQNNRGASVLRRATRGCRALCQGFQRAHHGADAAAVRSIVRTAFAPSRLAKLNIQESSADDKPVLHMIGQQHGR